MPLVNRLTRLFHADMHAVLDRLEEPDALLRQALREMEEDVAGVARRIKAAELEVRQSDARAAEIATAQARTTTELELAFGASNEALARTLLRRRLEGERLAARLAQHRTRLAQRLADDHRALEERRQRLDELRQRAALFAHEPRAGDTPSFSATDTTVTDADVELAWLREQQQRTGERK